MKLVCAFLATICIGGPKPELLIKQLGQMSDLRFEMIDVNQVAKVWGSPLGMKEWRDRDWSLLSLSVVNSHQDMAYCSFLRLAYDSRTNGAQVTLSGRTPLMLAAAFAGKIARGSEVLQVLVGQRDDLGIDLNAQDNTGRTALMIAVENSGSLGSSSADAVQILLDAGADTTLKTKSGESAWSLGIKNCGRRSSLDALGGLAGVMLRKDGDCGLLMNPIVEALQQELFDDASVCTFISLIRARKLPSKLKFFRGLQHGMGSSVNSVVRWKVLSLLDLNEEDECVICTDTFEVMGETPPPSILSCGHFFHECCLSSWVRSYAERHVTKNEVVCPTCNVKQTVPK